MCDQGCENKEGSYRCFCFQGYRFISDSQCLGGLCPVMQQYFTSIAIQLVSFQSNSPVSYLNCNFSLAHNSSCRVESVSVLSGYVSMTNNIPSSETEGGTIPHDPQLGRLTLSRRG